MPIKSPYRKCPGGKHLGLPPMLTAGALVDRKLRFIANRRAVAAFDQSARGPINRRYLEWGSSLL